MPLTTDRDIARILAATGCVALVGASDNPARPSNEVMGYLLSEGYEVYPVNPALAGRQLLGREVYTDLQAIPAKIDMVDVFRQSRYLAGIAEEAIAIGARTLWAQLGVVDLQAASLAETAGMAVVMDRCPAIEIPRLRVAGLLPR